MHRSHRDLRRIPALGLMMLTALSSFSLSLIAAAPGMAQDMDALNAAMREAQALGASGADFNKMQDLVNQMQNTPGFGETSAQAPASALKDNYFDVVNGRAYSDCDQYSDTQAFTFCQSAVHGYLVYVEVFTKEGPGEPADKIYSGHEDTVKNLINYVDNFMTAPRKY